MNSLTAQKIFIFIMENLNAVDDPAYQNNKIVNFNDEEYKEFKKFKNKIKEIYKYLNSNYQCIKNINKNNFKFKKSSFNTYLNFCSIVDIEHYDCDSRSIQYIQTFYPVKLNRLENTCSDEVRIFHVLNSILNGNHILNIDCQFNTARGKAYKSHFYLMNVLVNFLAIELLNRSDYEIDVWEPKTKWDDDISKLMELK